MRIDKSVINTINKQNVIDVIRRNGPINKAEIARITDLSIPTVMKMTDEFSKKGLIRDIGKGKSSGGKPPQLLEFVCDSFYSIGVDIGTTNIITVMMDLSAGILYRKIVKTCVGEPPAIVIRQVIDSIEDAISSVNCEKSKILGIGIGVAGLLGSSTDIVKFSPDFGWEDVDLGGPIREKFKMPIIVENVTRAMAMGEKWFGLGRDCDNFICINLGYGIGSAIFVDGELYRGTSGSSGELGHMTLEKDGPLCACGNRGCLEALASANAMTRQAVRSIEAGEKTSILGLAGGEAGKIDAKMVFDAAKQGDPLGLRIVGQSAEYIGIAIASIINFMEPELIILEGGVSRAGGILTANIEDVIRQRKMRHAGNLTRLAVSQLGKNATAIGAASFLLKALIEKGGDIEGVQNRGSGS
jgi:Transcriptional regulator/sugar kinase